MTPKPTLLRLFLAASLVLLLFSAVTRGQEAIANVVAPSAATQPVSARTVAGGVAFFDADVSHISNPARTRFVWQISDPSGRYNTVEGYNVAHVFNTAGTYAVTVTATQPGGTSSVQAFSVEVAPRPAPVYFHNDAELRAVVAKGNVLAVAANDVTVNGLTITAGAHTTIDLAGHTLTDASTSSHATIEGPAGFFVLQHGRYDNPAKRARPARVYNDSAIVDLRLLRTGEGANLDNKPHRVLLQDLVSVSETSVRGATVWVQGSDVVLLGVSSPNSLEAQTVRSGGTDRLLVAYCNLGNTDADGPTGPDFARQSLAIHPGNLVCVYKNTLTGGRFENGPLGAADGDKDGIRQLWLTNLQVIGNTVRSATQELQLCQRTRGVLFAENDVTVPNNMIGMKIEDSAVAQGFPKYGPGAIVADVWIEASNKFRHANGTPAAIYRGIGSTNINVAASVGG